MFISISISQKLLPCWSIAFCQYASYFPVTFLQELCISLRYVCARLCMCVCVCVYVCVRVSACMRVHGKFSLVHFWILCRFVHPVKSNLILQTLIIDNSVLPINDAPSKRVTAASNF